MMLQPDRPPTHSDGLCPSEPVAPFLSSKLDDVIKHHVLMVYRRCSGNKKQTAATLDISRTTLYRLLTEWGVG